MPTPLGKAIVQGMSHHGLAPPKSWLRGADEEETEMAVMTVQDGEWVNAEAKSGDSAALTEENVLEAARIVEEDGMKADDIIEEVTGCIQKGFNLFLQQDEKHKEAAEKMQEMVKAIMSTVDPTALGRSRMSAVSTAASTRSCSPGGRSATLP